MKRLKPNPCADKTIYTTYIEKAPSVRILRSQAIFRHDQMDTMEAFETFQNKPGSVLRIAPACLFIVLLCPFAYFGIDELWDFFFSKYSPSSKGNDGINEALLIFLIPVTLIYVLVWGFTLQDAWKRFNLTSCTARRHAALLKQISVLIVQSSAISTKNKMEMLEQMVRCTTQWMKGVMGTDKAQKCKYFS